MNPTTKFVDLLHTVPFSNALCTHVMKNTSEDELKRVQKKHPKVMNLWEYYIDDASRIYNEVLRNHDAEDIDFSNEAGIRIAGWGFYKYAPLTPKNCLAMIIALAWVDEPFRATLFDKCCNILKKIDAQAERGILNILHAFPLKKKENASNMEEIWDREMSCGPLNIFQHLQALGYTHDEFYMDYMQPIKALEREDYRKLDAFLTKSLIKILQSIRRDMDAGYWFGHAFERLSSYVILLHSTHNGYDVGSHRFSVKLRYEHQQENLYVYSHYKYYDKETGEKEEDESEPEEVKEKFPEYNETTYVNIKAWVNGINLYSILEGYPNAEEGIRRETNNPIVPKCTMGTMPSALSKEKAQAVYDFLKSESFIRETEEDTFLYRMGVDEAEETEAKIKWVKNKQLLREMLELVYEKKLKTQQNPKGMPKADIEKKVPQCFIDKRRRPIKLAKNKRELSNDSDKISGFFRRL